jgi:hypothetical protein
LKAFRERKQVDEDARQQLLPNLVQWWQEQEWNCERLYSMPLKQLRALEHRRLAASKSEVAKKNVAPIQGRLFPEIPAMSKNKYRR